MEITPSAVQGRGTTLVVRELLRGDRSYSELCQALPTLSDKMLSGRLAHLAAAVDVLGISDLANYLRTQPGFVRPGLVNNW